MIVKCYIESQMQFNGQTLLERNENGKKTGSLEETTSFGVSI